MNKKQEHNSFCYTYNLLLEQFQLKLFCFGKGSQNFASNVTLYPCERSRQNHLYDLILSGDYEDDLQRQMNALRIYADMFKIEVNQKNQTEVCNSVQ